MRPPIVARPGTVTAGLATPWALSGEEHAAADRQTVTSVNILTEVSDTAEMIYGAANYTSQSCTETTPPFPRGHPKTRWCPIADALLPGAGRIPRVTQRRTRVWPPASACSCSSLP